jgi:hypothetical protein
MPKHDEAYRQLVLRHALGISWARMLHDQHLAGIGRAGNANFTSPDRVRQEADWFVQAVERASAFWIDPDIAEFIQGAANGYPADLPITAELLPEPYGFLWSDEPLPVPYERVALDKTVNLLDSRPVNGVVWAVFQTRVDGQWRYYLGIWNMTREDQIEIAMHGDRSHYVSKIMMRLAFCSFTSIELGDTLQGFQYKTDQIRSEDEGRWLVPADIEQLRWLLAFFAFCRQRIITTTTEVAPRHAQRQAQRMNPRLQHDPTVLVVHLRRHLYRPADDATTATDAGGRRIAVRFLVGWPNGFRSQWYPSEGQHRPKWIAPYLKGPEDAPFVRHHRREYRVVQ